MDSLLWWSGLALWVVGGGIGLAQLAMLSAEAVVSRIWTTRMIVAFVADKLSRERMERDEKIPGG